MKKYRIYFNRKEDYPCVWSVDEGSSGSEVRVQWLSISTTSSSWSGHRFGPQPPNAVEYGENDPIAWIEVSGVANFQNGGVVFSDEVQK